MSEIASLFSNFANITWQEAVMWIIGGVLIYLGIKKKMEPTLLVPSYSTRRSQMKFF